MRAIAILALFVCSVIASAQSPASSDVAFEVASVKPNKSGSGSSSSGTRPGGAFVATNITPKLLILSAYRLRPFQVTGGPGWIDSDRFDLVARPPENAPANQAMPMLRTLLADRFKLITHTETKEQPIYALVPARADGRLGAQLKRSTLDCTALRTPAAGTAGGAAAPRNPCGINTSVNDRLGTMVGGGRLMAELATALGSFAANQMVLDRTGLTGTFDFELRWTPDATRANAPESDAPSIFTAIQEQLGLKLESQRGPVEFLVIDRIEQPTPD